MAQTLLEELVIQVIVGVLVVLALYIGLVWAHVKLFFPKPSAQAGPFLFCCVSTSACFAKSFSLSLHVIVACQQGVSGVEGLSCGGGVEHFFFCAEEYVWGRSKRVGYFDDIEQTQVAFSPFHASHIGTVQLAGIGEGFL